MKKISFLILALCVAFPIRIEVPIRFYILYTGRLELAAELGGVVGLKKNWYYYSYFAGLRFGVAL